MQGRLMPIRTICPRRSTVTFAHDRSQLRDLASGHVGDLPASQSHQIGRRNLEYRVGCTGGRPDGGKAREVVVDENDGTD
jgi:hypothetical protein